MLVSDIWASGSPPHGIICVFYAAQMSQPAIVRPGGQLQLSFNHQAAVQQQQQRLAVAQMLAARDVSLGLRYSAPGTAAHSRPYNLDLREPSFAIPVLQSASPPAYSMQASASSRSLPDSDVRVAHAAPRAALSAASQPHATAAQTAHDSSVVPRQLARSQDRPATAPRLHLRLGNGWRARPRDRRHHRPRRGRQRHAHAFPPDAVRHDRQPVLADMRPQAVHPPKRPRRDEHDRDAGGVDASEHVGGERRHGGGAARHERAVEVRRDQHGGSVRPGGSERGAWSAEVAGWHST